MTKPPKCERIAFVLGRARMSRGVGHLTRLRAACVSLLLLIVVATASPAQVTLTTLADFQGANGANPSPLVQGLDGNFYGTTEGGGISVFGTLFRVSPLGVLTTLYEFCSQTNCTDGAEPVGSLVLGTDGYLYGTTSTRGANGGGTVFRVAPSGTLNTIYSFCAQTNCVDGNGPIAGLVQGGDGNFYGTTEGGGAFGYGTIFKITPTGTLTTLHSFDGTDGYEPSVKLIQAGDGNFYGTTLFDGGASHGTIFKITPLGVLTTLYNFCIQSGCADGSNPNGGLVQATDGHFFGTTEVGGAYGDGTVFEITSTGTLTTLHSFDLSDGYSPEPYGALAQATDRNFYGTTYSGGTNGWGTIFKITPQGTVTTLYNFSCTPSDCSDGTGPAGGLIQATDGNFYGTTFQGGTNPDDGTVFSLSVGLGPFVETLPTSGRIGQRVGILGQGFTGATAVSFNGTSATFKVVSDTFLTTTVPAGATSGKVTVSTLQGTLASHPAFRVRQ